jgi:hypothetical protein
MKRVRTLVSVAASVIFVGILIRTEFNFENPTKNSNIPVGYWKVTDLPKLFLDRERSIEEHAIQFRVEAPIIGIEYLSNGVYQIFLSEVSPFSTLRDLNSKREAYFANQGNLFSHWDDIFVGGAKAVIFGTNPETKEQLEYKVIIYSPDFDSIDRELMFYLRIPGQDESFDKLLLQAGLTIKVDELELFESYNLVAGGLIVESFRPTGEVFGD